MEDLERYQIAKKVVDEWSEDDTECLDFQKWINDRIKPVDPLKEKWEKLSEFYHSTSYKRQSMGLGYHDMFDKFKEIFAEDLNGTNGLEKLIEWGQTPTNEEYRDSYDSETARIIFEKAEQIKKDLETK